MDQVTQILGRIQSGDERAAEQLLPLVYDELRKLAAQKLSHERLGQTLQATALVHEASFLVPRQSYCQADWRPTIGRFVSRLLEHWEHPKESYPEFESAG